jgi:hypothetical protein
VKNMPTPMTKKGIEWIRENGWDGHSIWKTEFVPFDDLGLDEEQKQLLTQTFRSDTSSPTSTIFKDGKIVKEISKGVYSLSLLSTIAHNLGVERADGHLSGRGSRARALTAAILKQFDPVK